MSTVYGGGQLENATGNYINAYTGEVTEFSGTDTLTPTMKTYYDTELLENSRPEMIFNQFAKKQNLPRNHGKTVEWRKWNTLPNADKLTEGVIPTGKKMGMTYLTDSVDQYGIYVAVTDQLELHAIDDVILGASKELGASAGITQDTLIRDDIVCGTSVLYAQKNTSGTMSDVSSRGGLNSTCKLTDDTVNRAATWLKKHLAPKINGDYVAVIHPSVAYDLRNSTGWQNAHEYCRPEEIFNGEIGKLHGVRFVEDTQAKIYRGPNLPDDVEAYDVASYASKVITLSTTGTANQLTSAQAAALKDAKIMVGGEEMVVASATAYSSGTAATITVTDTPTRSPAANDKIYAGGGAGDGGAVYCTMFFGLDSFATIEPEGAGLEMIVKPKSQAGGPLNQFSTMGYKLETNGGKILYQDRLLRVESCGAYSSTDVEN